ncbi:MULTISPECIES: Eco57I restriction-modification methylase domain-containing protein [unclassified Bradyrhizobium]|uniref:Eco57I restriction-modification methylase domain-containing protein n=1 Tax=unclassified Bradyrhizobium TaxID=2631580 RepID=UPI002915EC1E|nr:MULTISPECIES: N-6 DNA methylase [unclassified Bradyrhizobium]
MQVADTLEQDATGKFDVVVGNPPYARIGRDDYHDYVERWPELTDKGGYVNLSTAFLHHCRTFVKPGGLLSFVMLWSAIRRWSCFAYWLTWSEWFNSASGLRRSHPARE